MNERRFEGIQRLQKYIMECNGTICLRLRKKGIELKMGISKEGIPIKDSRIDGKHGIY